MKIVASLTDACQAVAARAAGADLIECRLDLMAGDPIAQVKACREQVALPIIATLRSGEEGGRYFGNAADWFSQIQPVLPFVEYVDVEQRFAMHAASIREAKKTIIASHHAAQQIALPELFMLERELRVYGDIPKIIITPSCAEDIVDLLAFTCAAKKPVCTGVMGSAFRYARVMLPFFGSELVYCHVGSATATGQYSVEEFVELMRRMQGKG
jgi:3-dehydroquinate dehydratase-1